MPTPFYINHDVQYSNIDKNIDKFLCVYVNDVDSPCNAENMNENYLAKRFRFPNKEPENFNEYKDTRTPAQKFSDIINLVNQKLPTDLVDLWSQVCKRDVRNPCYFKSGLAYMESQMKRVQKEFSFSQKLTLKPEINMPVSFKQDPHSKHCKHETKEGVCSYQSERIQCSPQKIISDLLNEPDDNFIVFTCKDLCANFMKSLFKLNPKYTIHKALKRLFNTNSKYSSLKLKMRKMLFKISCLILKVKIPEDNFLGEKEVFISNLFENSNLPYGKGFISPKNFSSIKEIKEVALHKMLVDSGSDCNITTYEIMKSLGYCEQDLKKCGNYSLKGSTGVITNCFIGTLNTVLFLQETSGKFYKIKTKFFIADPKINMTQTILGQPFLTKTNCKISYEKDSILVDCTLTDNCNNLKQVNLKLAGNTSYPNLVNSNDIHAGDISAIFCLKNRNSYLGQCIPKSKDLDLPLLDFSEMEKVLISNSQILEIIPQDNFSFEIPLLSPAEKDHSQGEIDIRLKFQSFISGHIQESLFGVSCMPTTVRPVNKPSYSPAGQCTQETGQSMECDQSKTTGGIEKCTGDISSYRSCLDLNAPENASTFNDDQSALASTFRDPYLSDPSTFTANCNMSNFEKTMLQDYSKQQLIDYNISDEQSFLAEVDEYLDNKSFYDSFNYSTCFSSRKDNLEQSESFSEVVDQNTVGRISLDTLETQEDGGTLDPQILEHLNKHDKSQIQKIIKEFPDFWAAGKFNIGRFKGFRARLEVKEGETAHQKERRMNSTHQAGVAETIEALTESGVFGLSGEKHSEFCANLNIVPKIESTAELRFQSKADRHISKMQGRSNQLNQPSGWRATFDFKDLNLKIKEVGKLCLPSISEIQTKVRNCLVSTLDLKNQFFSIELEPESRAFTNFYWKNRIFFHKRLPMGMSISPYIATSAMHWTFSDSVLEKFKAENNLNNLSFKHFSDFLIFYLDDCLIFNEKIEKNSQFNSKELHFILLKAVIFALSEAGWIASLKKANFLREKFIFLGTVIDTTSNFSKMQSDRIKSIQTWRSPRSAAEAGSRMSVLGYFSKFAPALRLIGLPIYKAIIAEEFRWGKLEEIAFENLKFLISLEIQLHHYNPNEILIITSDASAVSMNASYFNFNKNTGEMNLIDSQTKLFSPAEMKYTPVQKESKAFMYAIFKGESYIRSNLVGTWCLCDASSLQYIQRCKTYGSKQFNDSIFISSLPRLSIYYINGHSLLLSDIMTRQFQSVYLKNDIELSKEMCKFIPPLNALDIPNLTKLDSELLTDYILQFPMSEVIDTFPKRFFYHQNVHKTQLHNAHQNVSSELQLFLGLSLGWNSTGILSLPVWKDILEAKGDISKGMATKILKTHNLSKIHQAILDLNLDSNMLNNLLEKYHFVENKKEHKSFVSEVSNNQNSLCNCEECVLLLTDCQLNFNCISAFAEKMVEIDQFMFNASQLLMGACEEEIKSFNSKIKSTKCLEAQLLLKLIFFQFIILKLSTNDFTFNDNKNQIKVAFLNYCIGDKFQAKFSPNNEIQICCKEDIYIQPLDTVKLNIEFLLSFSGNIFPTISNIPELIILNSPASSGPIFSSKYVSFFNLEDTVFTVKANTVICSLKLDIESQNIILIKATAEQLETKQLNMQNCELAACLDNLSTVLAKTSSYFSEKRIGNFAKKSLPKEDKQLLISNFVKIAEIDPKNLPSSPKGEILCHYTSNQKQISRILLGQSLSKNNGIFSNKVLRELQEEDTNLSSIISQLENSPTEQILSKWVLKNKVLFRKSEVYGKIVHKLCLPEHLATEILFRFHAVHGLHYGMSQMGQIFKLNFFSFDQIRLIKEATNRCDICAICKNSYKKRSAGDQRTFEDELAPGATIVADVLYLPRDNENYKFIILFVDRLTSYACGVPLKELNSKTVTEALSQYLHFLPSPAVLMVDGDGVFSASFEKLCEKNEILLRTKIPKSSQTVGSAEVAVRDVKNLCTKIAHQQTEGRANWSSLLPIVLSAFNSRHPYNLQMSRKNLFLSPFYHNMLNLVFCPEEFANLGFNQDLTFLQKKSHEMLNNKRKSALLRLNSKLGKPSNFILTQGHIVTDSTSKDERLTLNGSKALVPGSLRLFKILQVHEGGQAALCRNLKTGQIQTQAISNLRSIQLPDLLHLTIDPEHSFADQLRDSRAQNLHGKFVNIPEEAGNRSTRSGRSFFLSKQKSILKNKHSHDKIDLNLVDTAQLNATKRGLEHSRSVGIKLTNNDISALKFKSRNNLKLYNVSNLPRVSKNRSKVTIDDKIKVLHSQKCENICFDKCFKEVNIFYLVRNLSGDISIKETSCLAK